MLDRLTRRTLGGIRALDHVTGRAITRPLVLTSDTLTFAGTLSGIYQIVSAPGFEEYAIAFETVPAPTANTFGFEIHDPSRSYLPVKAEIRLPRDAAKDAVADRVDSPLEVTMASSPARALTAGVTRLKASVVDQDGAGVPGALVVATRSGTAEILAWGLTDKVGEAFVPIIGIPLLRTVPPQNGNGNGNGNAQPLTSPNTDVRLSARALPGKPWPAPVATLLAGGPGLKTVTAPDDISLTAGGTTHQKLTLALD